MKTSDLAGMALRWAVAKCEGLDVDGVAKRKADHIASWLEMPIPPVRDVVGYCDGFYRGRYIGTKNTLLGLPDYINKWEQGGPILDREKISVSWEPRTNEWVALAAHEVIVATGPTPLVAAMRAFVASKLGDEVETPE